MKSKILIVCVVSIVSIIAIMSSKNTVTTTTKIDRPGFYGNTVVEDVEMSWSSTDGSFDSRFGGYVGTYIFVENINEDGCDEK